MVESHIPLKHFDIRLSTRGSAIELVILNITITIKAFINGPSEIETITKTPTTPNAFFVIDVAPITLSVASPMSFPTTGMLTFTSDLVVFATIPSTFAASVPSSESIPTKTISDISKTNNALFFKKAPNFDTSTSLEILLTSVKTVEIKTSGIKSADTRLLIIAVIPSKTG